MCDKWRNDVFKCFSNINQSYVVIFYKVYNEASSFYAYLHTFDP